MNKLLLFLMIGLTYTLAIDETLLKDMVEFDKAYIPALAFTTEGNAAKSNIAITKVVLQWTDFVRKYKDASPSDNQWAIDLDSVSHHIQKAKQIILKNKDVVPAHEELEPIRLTLKHLRERHLVNYYIDLLTDFHAPMEGLVLSVKGKQIEEITPELIATMSLTLQKAKVIWAEVEGASFDANLFGFDETKQKSLAKKIQSERESLTQMEKALLGDDKSLIIKSSLAIKPPFAQLFKMFGDFK